MHIYDMIVVGGGPAGYTSALYAARAGLDVAIIEKMSPGGQMALTGDIENYPGFDEGIDGFTLGVKMQKGAERFGAATIYDEVVDIEFSSDVKSVQTTSETFYAKTVVLALGANPRELGLRGEKEMSGRGVHYCAHCDGFFYKDKIAVVVGGGSSAVSDALYLSRVAKKVYLVHRRDVLRAEKIYQTSLDNADNIEYVWNSVVSDILISDKISGIRVKNVITDEFSDLLCDGIFVSIGRKPSTDFLKDKVALDEKSYIIADESTRTNIPGVFAVGDCRTKDLRQIVTAVSDGAVAVHFAQEFLAH